MAIDCDHPRPPLNLPGYTPPRLNWQPPSFIPENPREAARVIRESLQGIYNELMRIAARGALVPLIDATVRAREGQVIVGVADGQVIEMPQASGAGEVGSVRVIITDVVNPVTVAHPDGTSTTIDTAGVHDFALVPGSEPWQTTALPSAGTVPLSALEDQAANTYLGNITGASGPITANSLATLAGNKLTYAGSGVIDWDGVEIWSTGGVDQGDFPILQFADTTSIITDGGSFAGPRWQQRFQRAALSGAIAAAQNVNTTTFAGIRDNGASESDRTNLNFVSGTNTTATVTDDAANDELEIRFNVDDFPLTGLADQAAETFNGNFTAGAAPPTARAGSSVAGAGLTYAAGGTLAVGAGDGIDVAADDVAVDVTDIVDNVSITEVATNNIQRAALTGAITASAGSNATLFAGIRDNGVSEADRQFINLVSSTSNTALVTDDAANDELEFTFRRAALTGAITAAADSNATLFDAGASGAGLTGGGTAILAVGAGTGITVNANDVQLTTIADDTFMANVSGVAAVATGKTFASLAGLGIAYDATAHELDIDLADIDSTSIVINGTTLERAALTGAIAATQNSNATLFAGIRDNGSAETDRTNLNFISSTSATAVVTDDAVNDELEITFQRAALTGDVTASANSNTTAIAPGVIVDADVNASAAIATSKLADGADFARLSLTNSFAGINVFSGDVNLNGTVRLRGILTTAATGTINNLAIGSASVVRLTGSGPSLTGMVPEEDDQFVLIVNAHPTSDVTILKATTSTATNQFAGGSSSLILESGDCIVAWYDATLTKWVTGRSNY
jgi:hypothetical protein